jgi:YidC/Oxa1 family membrane protein insertase
MIAVAWWQAILNGLGALLAWLYSIVPNYGVAIILLTLLIRIVLIPLGIKQIRSMHAMQAVQPQLKEIQRKYKGDRQKQYEETQKLYKEFGVNPLSGCLPMLLQFPVLIALFAVLRVPGGIVHVPHQHLANGQLPAPGAGNSRLYNDIANQASNVHLVGANLLCSAVEAGQQKTIVLKAGESSSLVKRNATGQPVLDCGRGVPVRIPYYLLAVLMIASQWYQQRQTTKASPPGANTQQQQLTRIMPLLFGIWGFIFPAGLVLYWTTTNLVQIGQQHFMLPKRSGAEQSEEPPNRQRSGGNGGRTSDRRPERSRDGGRPARGQAGSAGKRAQRSALEGLRGRSGGPKPAGSGGPTGGSGGGTSQGPAGGSRSSGGGGRGGGDRKKRRKR